MKDKKTVLSFLITFLLCFLLIGINIANRNHMVKLSIERLIMEKSMMISNVVSKLLYKTQALSALVIQSNGNVEDFERVASAIVDDPAILNILIAPSGVVSKVYPLEGNEAVIGLDFFSEGAGNREAIMAKESGELVFGGPFELIQGGKALVGRLPVYIDSPNGIKVFWGLVSVTLKYPEALDGAVLDEIERSGLSYMIWRVNPDDGQRQAIAESENYNEKSKFYIEKHIQILNAHWYFRIAPNLNPYQHTETWILIFIGLCVSFLVAYIVHGNIALKRAKKQAEQASNAKSEFLANMNHEIRTPISGILGFAELATENEMDSETIRNYLCKIKDSADGLLGIIDDILDIEKIESGKWDLKTVPFFIQETIDLCEAICNLKAMEKGLALSVNVNPPIRKKLLGDPEKVRQILLNLLSNAVKFTNEGFVSLTVTTLSSHSKETALRFVVKDSGIGISAKQLDEINEAFTQADAATTRKYGGTGLGLTIAKHWIELMGGNLSVESVPGKGSKFIFTLTFEELDEPSTDVNAETHANDEKKPMFQGEVLVCEDNETNQMVIQGHLANMGIQVSMAPNGQEGVDMVNARLKQGKPYDLIFMDIHMPVMDGLQATKTLMEMGNQTPVIALTANIMKNDLENYKKHGMPVCLGKPFKVKELRECLLNYLVPVEYVKHPPGGAGKPNATLNKNPAIEVHIGLEQYEGDAKAYAAIVNSFYKNNRDVLKRINHALDAGDEKQAYQLVHSLRGASGAIGATKLADAAFLMENALLTATNDESPQMGPKVSNGKRTLLEMEFQSVLKELEAQMDEEDESQTEVMDRAKTIELIRKLIPLLKTGNTKCLDFLGEITETMGPVAKQFNLFIMQMERYDFELAYETLKSIRQYISVS